MVGLSYDPKIDRFLDSIGESPAGDLESVTVDAILEKVREKWTGREAFRRKNAQLLSGLRSLAAQNAELAVEFIEKRQKSQRRI